MEWYEKLTCEELLNLILELKNELDGRTISDAQLKDFLKTEQTIITNTFYQTQYTLFPNKDEIYCYD